MTVIDASVLADANSKDFVEEQARTARLKTAIAGFVTTAPRKVRRAVVHGTTSFANTTWTGVRKIGAGIWAMMPYMLYLGIALSIVAVTLLATWVNVLFIQFLFGINAILGYLAVIAFAVQLTALLFGGALRFATFGRWS